MGLVRNPQRFTVRIDLDSEYFQGMRYGSQANVVVYRTDNAIVNALGALFIRLVAVSDLCQLSAATLTDRRGRRGPCAAFRIAFAAAVGLTLGEVLGWDFPFLPAMLAVQLLSARGPVSVKQGLAFVAVMVAACAFAVLISQIFVHSPLVLLLVVSLLVFLEFLLLARGQAMGVAATSSSRRPLFLCLRSNPCPWLTGSSIR